MFSLFRCLLIVALSFVYSLQALAALAALDEYFDLAKKNSPRLRLNELEKQKTIFRLDELRGQLTPQVELSGISFYGNRPINNVDIDSQLAFGLQQTLYDGGVFATYKHFKNILPKLTHYQSKERTLQLFMDMSTLYFSYLKKHEELVLLEKQVKNLARRLKVLKKRSDVGRNKKTEYLRGLAQWQRLKSRIELLESEIGVLKAQLENLLGVDLKSGVKKIGSWRVFLENPGWISSSLQSHPILKRAQAEIKLQEQELTLAESKLDPTLSFSTNTYLQRRQFGRQDEFDVALSVNWRLTDFGMTQGQINQQKANLLIAKTQYQIQKRQINKDWEQLLKQYQQQKKILKAQENVYQTTLSNHQEHLKEFEKGLINYIDVTMALEDYIEASNSYRMAQYDLAALWNLMRLVAGEVAL